MKKQVSKLIAILVVITMLPLGSISANAVPNRPLPPRGGESRIVWHHHGWGIGTIEVFLSNNSINNINRLFDIGSSDAAKIVSIASTFRDLAGAASAPAAIIPIVAKEFVSMLIAEGFDRLQNANSGRDGVIFTMGVTQWGNNTTRFRPQLMRMGTPQMREIRHDSVRVFANPNDLNSIGTLGRTRISVIGTRLDAFEDNMRWYLLDSGGWIRAVMASEVPRDINITATAYPSGRGTVMGVGDGTLGFYRGQRVRLSAHPSRGWEFSGWYENGNRITGLNPLEFSAEQRRTIQARFRYTGAQIIRDRVAITTTSLPDGQVRRAFNARILATGATPITWTVASGSLPNGLNLNRNTGEITGTPTTEGTFTFTVRAANNATRDERQFTIRINDNTLQVWQMEILPASGQRFTTRADTPVRERPYARYPILERFPIGRAITVNGRGRNSEGNMWYRFTENGRERWIYSGNLSATNPVPQTPPVCTNHNWNDRGFCTRCGAEFRINITAVSGRRYITRDDVPVRARPYAPEAAIRRYNRGRAVNVNGRGRNSQGNIWYRLTDGNWIYSGNLSATNPVPQTPPVCTNHNWNDRGFCTRCGAEFRINITAVSGRRYITRDDVPVRARPYAPEAAIRRYNRGRAVNVNGRGRNSQGNIWYRLTDGTWIYSGNLSMTNPTAPTCTNHNWNDRGFCTRCGAEFRIGITTISPAQARFTTRADVPVRARPYAPEPILRRLANGTRVMVNGRGRNSQGNIWYRLTDGTWIYSGNLRR